MTPLQREPNQGERYQVRAVRRALDLLDCFTPTRPDLTLAELAEQTGLSTSTAYRLLQTLECSDYVERDPQSGYYRLGISCLRLGGNVMAQLNLRERLRPLLTELRNEYGETVHLAVMDRTAMEVIYVDKLDGWLPIGMMSSRMGSRSPAYCTGVGKVLLATADPAAVREFYSEHPPRRFTPNTITDLEKLMEALASIRCQGYALDDVEHEPDVKCVAVPVYDYTGLATCSVSMSGPETRMDLHIRDKGLVERMLKVAQDASAQLGYAQRLSQGPPQGNRRVEEPSMTSDPGEGGDVRSGHVW